MSLKEILHNRLRERGYLSYGEVMQLSVEEGYKGETATRRLREMPDIEPVMAKSKRGTNYIAGYRLLSSVLSVNTTFAENTAGRDYKLGELYSYTLTESQKVWKL